MTKKSPKSDRQLRDEIIEMAARHFGDPEWRWTLVIESSGQNPDYIELKFYDGEGSGFRTLRGDAVGQSVREALISLHGQLREALSEKAEATRKEADRLLAGLGD